MNTGFYIAFFTMHAIICIAYLLAFAKKPRFIAMFPVILCLPILGIVVLVLIFMLSVLTGKQKKFVIEGVFKESAQMEYITEFNEDKERNVVPVEEALIINEKAVQRSLVMEIAKRDPERYLTKLKRALLLDDTEIAHYAASSITELKRGFDKKLNDAERTYKRNPDSGPARREYIDVLNDVLKADLAIDKIKMKNMRAITEVLKYDIEVSEKPAQDNYDLLLDYLIKMKAYDQSIDWIERYKNRFSTSDRPLRAKLRLAYALRDNIMFKEVIDEIDKADFPITKKTIDMIEFWQGDDLDAHTAV